MKTTSQSARDGGLLRESDVADATQEVFLVVHRKLHAFEGRASVSTWLYRIALRVAAAQRRLARHRRELCSDEITGAAAADADLQAELEKRALLSHLSDARRASDVGDRVDRIK